jgi:hypothetical protein
MTNAQEKLRAQKKFEKLKNFLCSNLGSRNRKFNIIKKVDKNTSKSGEKEGNFVKLFLTPTLVKYFRNYPLRIIIEGANSKGETQLKNNFFGSKPAFDFSFKSETNLFSTSPFPLDTVGEVKYGNLNFRAFATGLGQIIGYLKASQFEANPKRYGYYIFFNTDLDKAITENDKKFLEEIWERENVFVVII